MRRLLFSLFTILLVYVQATAQSGKNQLVKTLNVAEGLPQSFVGGMLQDSVGFIWIGTRDGLARYDGKKFKVFKHVPGDTSSLSNSVIISLYMDKSGNLWILYETGDMDILNTKTESLFHFSTSPYYKKIFNMVKSGHSMAQDKAGKYWILSNNGGLFICNTGKHTLQFYTSLSLGLDYAKIAGIIPYKDNMLLITASSFFVLDENMHVLQHIPFTFTNSILHDANEFWKDAYPLVRKNGDIIMHDGERIIISNLETQMFKVLSLPDTGRFNNGIVQDHNGKVYFDNNKDIYTINTDNTLELFKSGNDNPNPGFKSALIDRSGMLWMGTNAGGIQLFDLRLSHMQARAYNKTFHYDVLKNLLNVPEEEMQNSFLSAMTQSFRFRWTKSLDKKLWFSRADNMLRDTPLVCYYSNGNIVQPEWHYTDTVRNNHNCINAMAFSKSGKLWGLDFYMRPVYFDTVTHAVTVYSSIASIDFNYTYTASNLLINGEDTFWITTALNGLLCYNRQTGKVLNYKYSELPGSLPSNQLMNMVEDAEDHNILWIGSLGGGLIRFNKTTGKCNVYTERNGLPNNTVYAIVPDDKGIFWCSSNKGIFSFNPKTKNIIQTFTSKDGLPGDEFNRYHFLKLPDGQIVFGGVNGYTVFDPLTITKDNYQPTVALTSIYINNLPADFGEINSPFKSAVNNLEEIKLPYDKNFLSIEFAGLEYNVTEKLHYRYMLQGYDKEWVNAGDKNIAAYTKLPPGDYTFKVNATNTAGQWSDYIKILPVIIQPPFWQTWWFTSLWILVAVFVMYFAIRYRILSVRKEEQQKAAFEREALELKAEALRAQMNPHFIFNCLNSIKSLIQKDRKQHAVTYLTTFSKLIRNQLNNAQREISLHEELETCRLYTQLEALRFGTKVICEFEIDEGIDTYLLHVPPLVLQPFIENAIWHGILPKDGGKVKVSVSRNDKYIQCAIEDDGIGRELSLHNKSQTSVTYQSKGMKLVQGRLNLQNSINNHGGTVELIDKKDAHGNSLGTLVIVKFKEA